MEGGAIIPYYLLLTTYHLPLTTYIPLSRFVALMEGGAIIPFDEFNDMIVEFCEKRGITKVVGSKVVSR